MYIPKLKKSEAKWEFKECIYTGAFVALSKIHSYLLDNNKDIQSITDICKKK